MDITAADAGLSNVDQHIVVVLKLGLWAVLDDHFLHLLEDEGGVLVSCVSFDFMIVTRCPLTSIPWKAEIEPISISDVVRDRKL